MVLKGNFCVELINAKTKAPFEEYRAANGDVYVEVEPGVEYYVSVTNNSPRWVKFAIFVDGKDLEYDENVDGGNTSICGHLKRKNNEIQISALKFKKLEDSTLRNSSSTSSSSSSRSSFSLPTRTIEVEVYSSVCIVGQYQAGDFTSPWKGQDTKISPASSNSLLTKCVKSEIGSVVLTSKGGGMQKLTERGHLLTKFTLHYCTTLGLIHVGILKRPPLWDYLRVSKPYKKNRNDEIVIKPNIITIETTGPEGQKYGEKTIEEFDLTNLP